MSQAQPSLFSSGSDLADLVVSSDLLFLSWREIQSLNAGVNSDQQKPLSLSWRLDRQLNFTILTFVTSPICTIEHLQQAGDLVSSDTLKQHNMDRFNFLCSKGNPSFSINRAAITLFHDHSANLSRLIDQIHEKDPNTNKSLSGTRLIITGHSLGGSVASLFTILLLHSINIQRSTKWPLCITFGSPLIGDKGLQQAISEFSKWNSCFLHVAAKRDPVPRLFISSHNAQTLASTSQPSLYGPFGTFLLCSDPEPGCTCVEDPEVVSKLLGKLGLESARNQVPNEELPIDYGMMIHRLRSRICVKGSSLLGPSDTHSLRAGIILQLEAIGIKSVQQTSDIDFLITEWETCTYLSNKKKAMTASRKLNEVKIKMAYLEWYKKVCKAEKIGYYDSYKNQQSRRDMQITNYKRFLTNYWKDLVEKAERKPQKEGLNMRLPWLYAGLNYRRMIEPLDIAEYYSKNGKRDYETQGRSRHYILLEQWQKEDMEKPAGSPSKKKKENVSGTLTEDSLFWAKVEEALISCKLWKDATSSVRERESAEKKLIEFEKYVMDQVKNYAVSPEIFLDGSSFMTWWNVFQQIIGTSYNSELVDFMKNRKYCQYEIGEY